MSTPQQPAVFTSCHRTGADAQRAKHLWSELSASYRDLEVAVPINDDSGWCVRIIVWGWGDDSRMYIERGLDEQGPEWRTVLNVL
jgi:hypothetical protein